MENSNQTNEAEVAYDILLIQTICFVNTSKVKQLHYTYAGLATIIIIIIIIIIILNVKARLASFLDFNSPFICN